MCILSLKPCFLTNTSLIAYNKTESPRFELTHHILQFAIHLRELAIRKNLKTKKTAIQKICRKKKT